MTNYGFFNDYRKELFHFKLFIFVSFAVALTISAFIAWNIFYFTNADIVKQIIFAVAVTHLNIVYTLETLIFNVYFCDTYLKFKTLNEHLRYNFHFI